MKDTVIDIQNRRSVKEYKPEQITDEELMAVLNAGMNAPSGGNKQSPVFIAVQNPEWIKKLCKLNAEIAGAPEGYAILVREEFSCLEFIMNRDTINWILKKLNTGGRTWSIYQRKSIKTASATRWWETTTFPI